jgi:hypothetical protein
MDVLGIDVRVYDGMDVWNRQVYSGTKLARVSPRVCFGERISGVIWPITYSFHPFPSHYRFFGHSSPHSSLHSSRPSAVLIHPFFTSLFTSPWEWMESFRPNWMFYCDHASVLRGFAVWSCPRDHDSRVYGHFWEGYFCPRGDMFHIRSHPFFSEP